MLYGFDRNEKRVIFERNIPVNDPNTKSARVGGEYKYVGGKWKMSV